MLPAEIVQAGITDRATQLARRSGIYLGTSSWKYPGWQGLVYRRHYPSRKAFQRGCLREYALHFPAVGVDATFYRFPGEQMIAELAAQTPAHFRFGLKVTEDITVYTYPRHARYGSRKGQLNADFLNAELFVARFLDRVLPLGDKLGPIMFQFGTLPRQILADDTFLQRLDGFLAALPVGPHYAVEVRNRQLFNSAYFGVLRTHGIAHVHNSWSWMPSLPEQLAQKDSFSAPYFVMRLLTPPQMAYEDAVSLFSPYEQLQQPLDELRSALIDHLNRAMQTNFPGYVFVNNRLEGSAPLTIEQVLAAVL